MKKFIKDLSLAILAGVSIALGGTLNILSKALLNPYNQTLATIVGSLLFPIGLTLVCFLGYNLFTGKIGYVCDNKPSYLGFLGVIYLGNIIGSLIMGVIAYFVFKDIPSIYNVALSIANKKMGSLVEYSSGLIMFLYSCLCGMLVYIAVFFYKTFKNKFLKVLGIFIPIAIFVYFGFDHCVANMFYFSFANCYLEPVAYLNILIATVGNSLGAIVLDAIVNIFKKSA